MKYRLSKRIECRYCKKEAKNYVELISGKKFLFCGTHKEKIRRDPLRKAFIKTIKEIDYGMEK